MVHVEFMDNAETTPLVSSKSDQEEPSVHCAHLRRGNVQHYLDSPYPMEASTEPRRQQDDTPDSPKPTNEDRGAKGVYHFFWSLPMKKKLFLIFCSFTNVLEGCGFSLLAPFFPQEAAKKGMSVILTGFVFSVFELIILVTSPIFGAYLSTLGPKFVFISATVVGGVCTLLFGTLDKCTPGTPFIVISICCRVIGAVGFSGVLNCVMALLSSEFPKNAGSCFAFLETAFSVGMMVGPAIGGGLYELGGFGLPFYVIGGLVILNGSLMSAILPNPQHVPNEKKRSQLSLLKNPMVLIPMMSISSGSIGMAFLDPTLANHLDGFGLSVATIGIFFVIVAGSYTLCSPIWGVVSDKTTKYTHIIVMGHLVFGLGFLILGPSKLLPFVPFELWTVVIGLVAIGCSFGCCLIPTMKCMCIGAVESGFAENLDTFAIVAGLVNAMYSVGAFLGPMIGGILVQALGFPLAASVLGVWNIFMSILTLTYFMSKYVKAKHSYIKLDSPKKIHGTSL